MIATPEALSAALSMGAAWPLLSRASAGQRIVRCRTAARTIVPIPPMAWRSGIRCNACLETRVLRPTLVNGRYGDPLLFVEIPHERDAVLVDLGDCRLLTARDLLRVRLVLVSHRHMDHFTGFDALLRVNVGREAHVIVAGPVGIIDAVGHRLAGYTWDLAARYANELVSAPI
jgi:glyoxylase-like metal-dependent hydrolase (beta-lactamase superfamily II)